MAVDSSRKNISIDLERGAPENFEILEPTTRKNPGFRQNVYDYLTEFSSNTGIHGFQYMGERERSLVEKCYWVILFSISLCFCIFLVIQAWTKWDQTPVIVSFAPNPTPLWKIPFPAITICPETKARQRVYNYTYYFFKVAEEMEKKHTDPTAQSNLTAEELQRYLDTTLLCYTTWGVDVNQTASNETIEHLIKIAPPKAEVFFDCTWKGLDANCDEFFYPILTVYGMCFTFNMLDRSELFTNAAYLREDFMSHDKRSEGWSLDGGYPKIAGNDTFPRRVMSTGYKGMLDVTLRAYEQDQDYICQSTDQGFKVFLHHPAEVPGRDAEYFQAPLNRDITVGMKAEVMTTSTGLRNYDPHIKRCYFSDQRQLMFFKVYTQQNCRDECLANYTLARCKCAAFYMLREESTRICGNESTVCISEVEDEILAREVESELHLEDGEDDIPTTLQCDCLPTCSSITYNAETTQNDYNFQKLFELFKDNLSESKGLQMTYIKFNFEKKYFTTYERNELYGQTDFISNCGGLLGLFTGFSFLTIAEIVYFLSLRVICNVKKNGIHFWSGSKTSLDDDATLPK